MNTNTRGRTYDMLVKLIENGKYESKNEIMEKMDVFLLNNRITLAEYNSLVEMLNRKEPVK